MPTVCVEMLHFVGDFDADRRADALTQLKSQLSVMAAIGGRLAMTPASYGMFSRRLPPFEPPRSGAEDTEVLTEAFGALAAHAEAEGVTIALEPLNRYEDHMVNTLAQGAELIAAAGSPGVRLLADTYHMNIEEDDLCAALRGVAGVLGAVHLSDSNRHQPGTGHVPFARVLGTLAEVGFEGVLSVECRLRGEPGEAVTGTARYLRGLLDAWPA